MNRLVFRERQKVLLEFGNHNGNTKSWPNRTHEWILRTFGPARHLPGRSLPKAERGKQLCCRSIGAGSDQFRPQITRCIDSVYSEHRPHFDQRYKLHSLVQPSSSPHLDRRYCLRTQVVQDVVSAQNQAWPWWSFARCQAHSRSRGLSSHRERPFSHSCGRSQRWVTTA